MECSRNVPSTPNRDQGRGCSGAVRFGPSSKSLDVEPHFPHPYIKEVSQGGRAGFLNGDYRILVDDHESTVGKLQYQCSLWPGANPFTNVNEQRG